jgi:hypothetical protein
LKSFLLYAKNGIASLTNSFDGKHYDSSTAVSDFLASDLRQAGLDVNTNVGTSLFRIDVAIKDPANPSSYLLGITCDSHSYADSATCQDRNIVQPSMLNRLHWRIIHVWSVEYLDHPQEVVKRILAEIEEAKAPATAAEKVAKPTATIPAPIVFERKMEESLPRPHEIPYPRTDYPCGSAFYDEIRVKPKDVQAIVEREWPVSRATINARCRQIYDVGRIGSAIYADISEKLASGGYYVDRLGQSEFYWPSKQAMMTYKSYRPVSEREMMDVPYQEIGNAMLDILVAQGAMTPEDLMKQISLCFGWSALKEKTRQYLEICLRAILADRCNGIHAEADGRISA